MPFFPEIERKTPEEIKKFQEDALAGLLKYLSEYSMYYKTLFREYSIDIRRIRHLEDLVHIPLTDKSNLQQFNKDFICVPHREIVDFITTSGTMGDPVTVAMTNSDLDRLAYNEAISFTCADGSADDIYQLMTTLDRRFMAGMAYFLGIRMMGAGIVRVGNGIPELQWDTINRIKPNAIVVVPSFILKVIEYAEQNGIDYRSSSLVKGVCIGEPLRNPDMSLNALGKKIQEKWPLKLFSTYASSEMATSFTECREGQGGHHHPELIIVEFLDDNGNPAVEGQPGEVTITTLGVRGMPLLRFKTGDICYHHTEPCACGRTTMRLGPVIGRRKQMIKFKGTTLYPPALYDILDNIPYIRNYYVEVYTNEIGTDEIIINAGTSQYNPEQEKDVKDHFRARLRVAPQVRFHKPEEIMKIQFPEGGRKAVKFIDNRNTERHS
ncbi:MAG: AMP-binding protein [Bacteroidetes bacterium]|nr:AMP-binding protein [Bacteroidota bacterium]